MKRVIKLTGMAFFLLCSIPFTVFQLQAQIRFGTGNDQLREGVCFYTDENYRGDSYCVEAGDSRRNVEGRYNDRFSSIRVFGGVQVSVFQDENFTGPRATFTGDTANLQSWNDRITSFQVSGSGPFGGSAGNRRANRPYGDDNRGRNDEPRIGICFYTDENYKGDRYCAEAGEDIRNVEDRFNDRFSSLRVFGRAQVVVYENEGFNGARTILTGNVPNLRTWNDRITSFQVAGGRQFGAGRQSDRNFGGRNRGSEPRNGACFYTDENYRGDSFCLETGERVRNVENRFNDKISSIRVYGRVSVTIFEDENFSGSSRLYNRDASNLGNFNDRLTSVEIR